jgi:hypothetical protein
VSDSLPNTRAIALVSLALAATMAVGCGGATATASTPRSERIPAGARRLVVTATKFRRTIQGPTTITSRRAISRAASLLNALPLFPPGTYSCPADFGLRIRLAFYRPPASSRAPPLAVAVIDPGGCGEVYLSLSGVRQPPLAGGRALVKRLSTVLHVKLDSGPS